jgi:hypothetical protein
MQMSFLTGIMPSESGCAEKCCCGTNQRSSWVKTVDLVCRIALAAFSAWIAPIFFGLSFGIGTILGCGYALITFYRNKTLSDLGEAKPICAQGFMNYLSGLRYPAVINSVVTAVFIGAHVRHDPLFFVPFVGLFVGVWVGSSAITITRDLQGRVFQRLC